ncbi:MAG: hypothetical protein COA79_01985 [Planctomycetota bacterium]|nr:MAG: hypothetical protein COA79_01985 [Planctomycetota bacterium]
MYKSSLTQVLGRFSRNEYEKKLLKKQEESSQVLLGNPNDNIEFSVAKDVADRIQAYRLVYKLYIEKEFATPSKSKMWYSLFDANPNTMTFIAKKNDKVVGTITIVIDSITNLPADHIFHNDIQNLRNTGRVPAEIISLAIDKDIKEAQEILIKLFNFIYIAGKELHSVTDLMITVNPKHVSFYKKRLLFNQLGDLKAYDKVGGADAVLLNLNIDETESTLKKIMNNPLKTKTILPFFTDHEEKLKILKNIKNSFKSMSPAEFIYFFKDQLSDSNNTSDKHLGYLKQYYDNASNTFELMS